MSAKACRTAPDRDAVSPDTALEASTFGAAEFGAAAGRIVAAGRRLDRLGLVPATAGNLSERIGADRIAVTRSGGHKGFLDARSVIEVDMAGRPLVPGDRPSAETTLHCQIYATLPQARAVVHGHSVALTALTRVSPGDLEWSGYEMLKAFGTDTHDTALVVPVFANDQNMDRLAAAIAPRLRSCRMGYALRGHGFTAWGNDMDDALARLEAIEFLLRCTLAERSLAR